jgi:monofunctional biosynthetic peptidoglycan transglycosylase
VIVELATIPWFSIARLKNTNPGPTALMQQRMEEAREQGKTLRITHRWIPLSKIPRHVIDAVIVAEDGTFYSHSGIDWFEVQESIERDIQEHRAVRGGSTITQQLAKNLYLSTSKDPIRKLKELMIALLLEHELSKNRILELYLNVIEWGRGIFGIEAASQAYFGKSASDLTLDEAVRLAAVIPSPLRHRPDADSRYVVRRKGIVLQRLAARYGDQYSPQKENSSSQSLSEVPEDTTTDSTDIDEGDNGL